jgi:hypothetical protein
MVPPHGAVAFVPVSPALAAAHTAIDPPQPGVFEIVPEEAEIIRRILASTTQGRAHGILRLGSIAIESRRRAGLPAENRSGAISGARRPADSYGRCGRQIICELVASRN